MFSDLVGSMALSARIDPEDLREVISAYQQSVAETVRRFGGFVAKYMGDGVLIYFGYPRAHENDAERAVRAGRLTSMHQISYALMMRTTLSLDDDVAATLERMRRSRRVTLKRLVNEALRRGLDDMSRRRRPRVAIRTRAVALGRVRIPGIDNIGEALAIAEGESFR